MLIFIFIFTQDLLFSRLFKHGEIMKNKLLSAAFILTSVLGFAQLTVKPNSISGVDSYIYVKDQVLFVEKDINLTENSGADFKASIYLRDGGQLIQGGTISTNSGSGFLSVRQTDPETNAWAYRYWASPVGNADSTTDGNQNFGVGLLYDHLVPENLTKALVTSTTAGREGSRGTSSSAMTISTRWIYTHMVPGTEAEGNYHRINGSLGAPAGYGFTMKGVGDTVPRDPQTYEFRGRPNSGDFTIPVGFGDFNNQKLALMTLSGNPYPSALDLNKLFYEIGNEKLGSFWYYDEDRSVASHLYSKKPYGYGTWIPSSSDPNGMEPGLSTTAPFYIWNAGGATSNDPGNGRTKDIKGRRFAPIGQGIMFVGDENSNSTAPYSTVKIKNTHRVFVKENTATSIFHRPGNEANFELSTNNQDIANTNSWSTSADLDRRMPQMRFYVVFDDAVTRDLVLAFSHLATDGYDRGLDGHSPMGLKTDAYFPIGTNDDFSPFVIQTVNFSASKQIPINFTLNKQTKIDVRLIEEIKKPYEKAYLYDKQEHITRRLYKVSTAATPFYLPAGEHKNRFYIVFHDPTKRKEMSDDVALAREEVLKNVTFFQNNPARQLEISNPDSYNIKSASLYDMNGKLVAKELKPGKESRFTFYTGNLSDGVYLVKLITKDNTNIDYKAIIHNK